MHDAYRGRLIEFEDGKVRTISPPVERLLQDQGYTLQVGDPQNTPAVSFVTTYMAEAMARVLKKEVHAQDQVLLLGHEPNWLQSIDTMVFSGGISECMYHHTPNEVQEAQYDDIGIQLAEALLHNASCNTLLGRSQ